MSELEGANLSAIRRLNQRGGRFLTVADLMEAGTLDRKLLEFFTRRLGAGDSLLAAAGPSGTGKTTLMGALLNLIPPGVEIQTAERGNPIPGKSSGDSTLYMAHELNDAPYYGYIWGDEARQFLRAAIDGRIAATLHAESLQAVRRKLTEPPVSLAEEELNQLDLIVTMKTHHQGRDRIRRVDRVYGALNGEFRTLFRWDPKEDEYREVDGKIYEEKRGSPDADSGLNGFIKSLLNEKPRKMEKIRQLVLDHVYKKRK
ncbi:hypothetical protein KGY71_07720 [Candidatus Bipolaricaulota bacterium]|nr:hypothetical protein [Candidatus Bipolaricaulota bacterium]